MSYHPAVRFSTGESRQTSVSGLSLLEQARANRQTTMLDHTFARHPESAFIIRESRVQLIQGLRYKAKKVDDLNIDHPRLPTDSMDTIQLAVRLDEAQAKLEGPARRFVGIGHLMAKHVLDDLDFTKFINERNRLLALVLDPHERQVESADAISAMTETIEELKAQVSILKGNAEKQALEFKQASATVARHHEEELARIRRDNERDLRICEDEYQALAKRHLRATMEATAKLNTIDNSGLGSLHGIIFPANPEATITNGQEDRDTDVVNAATATGDTTVVMGTESLTTVDVVAELEIVFLRKGVDIKTLTRKNYAVRTLGIKEVSNLLASKIITSLEMAHRFKAGLIEGRIRKDSISCVFAKQRGTRASIWKRGEGSKCQKCELIDSFCVRPVLLGKKVLFVVLPSSSTVGNESVKETDVDYY